MNFFTSDTHFDHRKIIEFCGRPFESVEHMNAEMVRRWNAVVSISDTVTHLGDFALTSATRVAEIRSQLAGEIVIVVGNHDSRKALRRAGFDHIIEGSMTSIVDGQKVYLRHVPHPLEVEDRDSLGVDAPAGTDLHLCGHVHNRWKRVRNVVNVGVDQWDFAPVSLGQILGRPSLRGTPSRDVDAATADARTLFRAVKHGGL